jgi:hypothetical protein
MQWVVAFYFDYGVLTQLLDVFGKLNFTFRLETCLPARKASDARAKLETTFKANMLTLK